jgi:hypothetical protein
MINIFQSNSSNLGLHMFHCMCNKLAIHYALSNAVSIICKAWGQALVAKSRIHCRAWAHMLGVVSIIYKVWVQTWVAGSHNIQGMGPGVGSRIPYTF